MGANIMNISYVPSPKLFLAFILCVSSFSLAAAFIAQFGFDLRPCYLCLLQRIPFANQYCPWADWISCPRGKISPPRDRSRRISLFGKQRYCVLPFGVERKWWEGLTGCTTPDMSGSIEDLLERIKNTDVVRCDEIPWELFGLSMANYNVVMCLGLGFLCFIYLFVAKHSKD
jgi:disulfide bond formation protein DsbB